MFLRLNAAKRSGPLLGVVKEVKMQAGANGGVTFEEAHTAFDSSLTISSARSVRPYRHASSLLSLPLIAVADGLSLAPLYNCSSSA